jgi:hypothetical protein
MKNTFFITVCFVLFFTGLSNAQNSDDAAKGIIYYKDYSVGIEAATNGFGAFVNISRRISLYKTKFYQVEIANITNPKAVSEASEYSSPVGFDSPKPFDYGKQNNFYIVNVSIGMKRLIAEKADKSGVELSLKYMGGISLGILKPYDLDLIYSNDNTTISYILQQSYTQAGSRFLNPEYIYGSSGFTYGLNQVSFVPGIHFKAGLNFDWAKYDDNIKALEVGIACNAYYEKVPIMVSSASNQQIIPELYVSVELGKRR